VTPRRAQQDRSGRIYTATYDRGPSRVQPDGDSGCRLYENAYKAALGRSQRTRPAAQAELAERAGAAYGGNYDAIVVGGGPSGAVYAMTLARKGHTVLLLEKDNFPRFHIGEAFLPYVIDILAQLGILDRFTHEGFIVKKGLEISTPCGTRLVDLGVVGDAGYRTWSYQVERARFDQILFEAAGQEPGVTALLAARASQLLFCGSRVSGIRYTRNDQQFSATAEFVVDASGRAGFVARALRLRQPGNELRMAAVFKHFRGLDERNNPGRPGDTQLAVHEDGWVWAIPIRDDIISVGVMAPAELLRAARPEDVFETHLRRSPRTCQRLRGTEPWRGLSGESGFGYYANTLAGPGFFLVGDAGCFSDPLFSAGVYLALATGRRAAEETAQILAGRAAERLARKRYEDFYKTGYETYYRLIRAAYAGNLGSGGCIREFLTEGGMGERERVLALNGDFWTQSNPLTSRIRQEPSWALFDDFDPLYGCPVYGTK
jgi:FADH2-dependent halogenase